MLRGGEKKVTLPQHTADRNDPCPCGSGLKYKKCCLAKVEGERQQFRKDLASREMEDKIRNRRPASS